MHQSVLGSIDIDMSQMLPISFQIVRATETGKCRDRPYKGLSHFEVYISRGLGHLQLCKTRGASSSPPASKISEYLCSRYPGCRMSVVAPADRPAGLLEPSDALVDLWSCVSAKKCWPLGLAAHCLR